ncbi:uncharacterized protein GIQ15_03645 [Arthroderma uncinatum]|uniref:uncharacterized protein n=1 Tax=Arthroderma uncinatum TaxID=74035 RepID=UPI00144AE1AE|nr:uncharacterized protein GIQ15_03645 [Arthroderma uncinatum]KAF3484321.1 hypothetical protein GIQ15_03645 [Arthroderma uncinatum]
MTSNAKKRCSTFPSSIDIGDISNSGANRIPNEPAHTEKRCITFLSSRDLEHDRLLEGNNIPELQHKSSSSLITELPLEPNAHTCAAGSQKRPGWKPPHLPISAKRTSTERIDSAKRFASRFPESGSPWARYRQFTKNREPGKVVLAYDINAPKLVVAIKECKLPDTEQAHLLFRTSHPNIVNLQDAFLAGRDMYLAYERMDLPLEQLHSDIKLEERHIATICREYSSTTSIEVDYGSNEAAATAAYCQLYLLAMRDGVTPRRGRLGKRKRHLGAINNPWHRILGQVASSLGFDTEQIDVSVTGLANASYSLAELAHAALLALCEDNPNAKSFSNGEKFRNLRLNEKLGNQEAANAWRSRLTANEQQTFNRIFVKLKPHGDAMDELLPVVGLWPNLPVGSLH